MCDGLDRDDIYIMVEDEFHAVAKQFTQHLHHAEYVRLKNLSKARNASTISTISHPTDSITTMRIETKKKKENEAKAAKQKAALEQIKGRVAPRTRSDSDDESDVQVSNDDDPWAGTTLQGLMTSPSRKNTSLTGLQGVLSSTRAAAGFSKPQASVAPPRQYDLDPQTVSKTSTVRTTAATASRGSEALRADDDETASDDDDLDAPVTCARPIAQISNISSGTLTRRGSTKTNLSSKRHVSPTRKDSSPNLSSPPLRSNLVRPSYSLPNSKSIPKRTKALPLPSVIDEMPKPSPPQSEALKRIMKRRANLNAKRDSELAETKNKAGSVNEIPIFLV